MSDQESKGTYSFISLGCPKATVDSERMLGKLAQDGYTFVGDADGADVVVINTCGFIEPARQESLAVIREMLALKEQGRVGSVVVAGCLAERKGDDLLKEVRANPGLSQTPFIMITAESKTENVIAAKKAAPRQPKWLAWADWLVAKIAARPDIYLRELQAELKQERGEEVCLGTICAACRALEKSRKKRR